MDIKGIDEIEQFILDLRKGHELIPVMQQILRELRHLRLELDKHFEDEKRAFEKARALNGTPG